MTNEFQALWQRLNELLIILARRLHAGRCPITNRQHAVKFPTFAFFYKVGPVASLRRDAIRQVGEGVPRGRGTAGTLSDTKVLSLLGLCIGGLLPALLLLLIGGEKKRKATEDEEENDRQGTEILFLQVPFSGA